MDTNVIQDASPVIDTPASVDSHVSSSNDIATSSDDAVTQAAGDTTTTAPVVEKTFSQLQVDKLVAREKRLAAEKARNEVQAQFESHLRAQQQQQPASANDTTTTGYGLSDAELDRRIQERAYVMSEQARANHIAREFESKINAAIDDDPEFATAYEKLNVLQHPELVLWTNGLDNTASVVKDIANNPAKLSQILMLAKSGFPQLAQDEFKKLSASIKANETAQKQPIAPEPLSQIKPSTVGSDNGQASVKDFQKMFRG